MNKVGERADISSKLPTKVIVNAIRAKVTITPECNIREMWIGSSCVDCWIELPKDRNPMIEDNGMSTRINYY